ncbi:TetR/AcrR family transcriptional regulator [Microbacterium resistens]
MPPNAPRTAERILDVAADLFVTRGYGESPLSLIAKEVGITKASLYYHYPSKESMLQALVSPLLDDIDALLEETPEHFDDPEERRHFLAAYVAVLRAHPRAVAVIASRPWAQNALSADPRIRRHRDRTIDLATPPDATDEERVRALLAMDIIHRELVFTEERLVLADLPVARRQALALEVAHRLLDGPTPV